MAVSFNDLVPKQQDYTQHYEGAGERYGVDPLLVKAIAVTESEENPRAVSPAGAEGLMQIMPPTARSLGVSDPFDAEQSIYGGTKYVRQMHDQFGNPFAAIAAYHGGPDVSQWGPKTQAYVQKVADRWDQYRAQAAKKPAALSFDDLVPNGGAALSFDDLIPQDQPSEGPLPRAQKHELTGATWEGKPVQQGLRDTPSGNLSDAMQIAAEQGMPPSLQPMPEGRVPSPLADFVSRTAAAAKQGWEESPTLFTPEAQQEMENSPVLASKYLNAPLGRIANAAIAAPNALFRAGQEAAAMAGEAVGQPQLGRDIAAMPEAFMGTPHAFPARTALHDIAEGKAVPAEGPGSAMPTLEAMAREATERTAEAPKVPEAPVAPPAVDVPPVPVPEPPRQIPDIAPTKTDTIPAITPEAEIPTITVRPEPTEAVAPVGSTPAAAPPAAAPTRIRTIEQIRTEDGVGAKRAAEIQVAEIEGVGRPVSAEEVAARKAGVAVEPEPVEPGNISFTTAKGSTYEVFPDGTTTRDKAFRPEHGEAEQGPQPRSQATVYVTPDQADALSEFQTSGTRKAIARLPDGQIGVMYLDGPNAGKIERRTVAKPQTVPAVGLIPVEVWDDGLRAHFGNVITDVRGAEKSPAPPAATTQKAGRTETPFVSVPKEPERLVNFLRRPTVQFPGTIHQNVIPGGLKDVGGDLNAILGGSKGRPGLINNKTGRHLDAAAQHAFENGYFPGHSERPTINELLDAIRDDHTGIARYSDKDADAVAAYHEALGHNSEIDRLATEHEIPTHGITQAQFFDQLHDRLSVAGVAREMQSAADAHEAAYREAEQAAKAWIAYHGTPHEFEAFDLSKIGTGEGAQAYGHGLYFAENPKVAGQYRDATSVNSPAVLAAKEAFQRAYAHLQQSLNADKPTYEAAKSAFEAAGKAAEKARKENAGNLYTVRLRAKPEEMLDWDTPLSRQSDAVRNAFAQGSELPPRILDMTGREIYAELAKSLGKDHMFNAGTPLEYGPVHIPDEVAAARVLSEKYGIKGIRYLDHGSRDAGEGTRNVVMFDPRDIEITHRNGEPVKPEAWHAQRFYGESQTRTLKELEDAYRQEEAATAAREQPGRVTESRSAAGDQGPIQKGGGPRNGGAGIAGRAAEEGAPATDLLGRPLTEPRGARTPEPTVRTDPNQVAMPGMEPSAVQAQAARDQAGRGAILPEGPQKPANEGLFAPDTSGQGKLYAGPMAIFDPEAWRWVPSTVRPLARAVSHVGQATANFARAAGDLAAPMRAGTQRAQAFAADFANALRGVQYRYGQIDREIERKFNPKDRDRMGRALDAQSVFEQELRDMPAVMRDRARAEFDATGAGLAGLKPDQRAAIDMLDALSQDVWRRMQERGLVKPEARGLPYYFPRQIVMWTDSGDFARTEAIGGAGRALNAMGLNLTTQGPRRREHLTPEETERAAKVKLGAGATLLRDIRSLPARLAYSERAIAGANLMDAIERVGKDTGVNLVVRGDIPGLLNPADYKTMADHPAGRRWVGNGWQAIHIANEFEGPLNAVLTKPTGQVYRAAMALKSGIMTSIMWSPFIHLAVEYGRSAPFILMHPGATLKALRNAHNLRQDLAYMDRAITDGIAPLGRRWSVDPVSIADQANVEGRNSFLRALQGMRDAMANGAGAIGGQWLHDVVQHPHQTLLWDQVFNLQMGLYDSLRDHWIAKGDDPAVAGTKAAHVANRYAGALPSEHLSRAANMMANLLLFSRSFTLGNLGVIKDMFRGAPPHVLARIEQMAGPEVAAKAKSDLKRKAISAFVMDIGMYVAGGALLQQGLSALFQSKQQDIPFSEAAQNVGADWLEQARQALIATPTDPLAIFNVLPQHWNEPGKRNRIYWGNDEKGSGIYLRLPFGKVGEEFIGYFTEPGAMLLNKLSPIARVAWELAYGQDSLGRLIYPPHRETVNKYLETANDIVKHIARALGPTSLIEGASELYRQNVRGEKTGTDPGVAWLKVLGPATGLATVSQGYPGGPAAGEMHAMEESQRYDLQQAMPEIRLKIRNGKQEEARDQMRELGADKRYQDFIIKQTNIPGMVSRKKIQHFRQTAPEETQQRYERLSQ